MNQSYDPMIKPMNLSMIFFRKVGVHAYVP